MSEEIYLDHAATTQMWPEVKAVMEPYLTEKYGNASTAYDMGKEAKKALDDARGTIADVMDADPEEIFFTSGGSESDNWAIKSIAGANKRRGSRIITTKIEHHAVLNSCKYLEELGYEVCYLDVDENGIVDLEQLKEAVSGQTALLTVMYGNNEIGTLEPIAEIGMLARQKGIPFHTDAVQVVGQLPVPAHRLPIDLLSASGHKFHGPKGIGFLYVRDEVRIPAFIHGGGQEAGKRAGTENVASIVGMAEALKLSAYRMRRNCAYLNRLRNYFVQRVMRECSGVRYNGHPHLRLPGNASFSFAGVDATALLVLLEEDRIRASAGSACSTGEARISHVIEAIGVPEEYAAGTVRFTLGAENTRQQIDWTVRSLKKNLALLRGEMIGQESPAAGYRMPDGAGTDSRRLSTDPRNGRLRIL